MKKMKKLKSKDIIVDIRISYCSSIPSLGPYQLLFWLALNRKESDRGAKYKNPYIKSTKFSFIFLHVGITRPAHKWIKWKKKDRNETKSDVFHGKKNCDILDAGSLLTGFEI